MNSPYALNYRLMGKLLIVAAGMFAFGYMLAPIYKAICNWTGINVLALGEREAAGSLNARATAKNTQVDYSRTVMVEFDTNARGAWKFRPEIRNVRLHPGELTTVMFEIENQQPRTVKVQAIPSYAPGQAQAYFNKLECFCFTEHTLGPGEVRRWPVVFYISPKAPRDLGTVTLSYTFFEVGGAVPKPVAAAVKPAQAPAQAVAGV
ncbi:MAG: cytochrome c oxidase assembly protein [Oxalobacteraceae bacterium]|jgi:cytochrome c oxidase assembly protein subunit 11|nr:cytochrome c oxidase assembly protein [Oxalobacteraceae bacterium]